MTTVGKQLEIAIALLKENKLVAIPTETVYGLAGNALNESAVIKIYSAKERPSFNPLIIHVASVAAINEYAALDAISQQLAEAFMPGPFTLLLTKKSIIPDLVTAGSSKVAVRIPRHPLTLRLLQKLNFPLAAPSANLFGYVSPTTAEHVLDGLNNRVDYILDGGPCEVGVESTIAEVTNGKIILHRLGAVTAEEMEAVTGLPVIQRVVSESFDAPGQMKSHYATKIPLYLGSIPTLFKTHIDKKIASISFCKSYEGLITGHQYILSPKSDINEAAQKLFAVMRNIDEGNFDLIIAEKFPDKGLGRAINDRLERAQAIHK